MTVSVLMCGDGLTARDRRVLSEASVGVVDGLCDRPDAVTELADESDGVVLVLHEDQVALGDFQTGMRAAGLDPLGALVLEATEYQGAPERLVVTLAGARARVAEFPGSSPAHAKPTFPTRMTRRSLFTVPQPVYVSAPSLDPLTCGADDGCTLCVESCPRQAYTWLDGRIAYDKDACQPCGRCVTTCPTGSITNPSVSPAALASQVEALALAAGVPIGVAFRCSRARKTPAPAGWHAIEVPCTGMVTATWVVAPLLLGAAQVAVLPCSINGCDRSLDASAVAAVRFCADLLAGLGIDSRRIAIAMSPIMLDPLPAVPIDDGFGAGAAARVFAALRMSAVTETSSLDGEAAPLGVVAIEPSACTMCTKCAQICPTGALRCDNDAGSLTLSFDPSRCTACDQCVSVCPEVERGAIRVGHRVDFGALAAGRIELNRSSTHTCERCGQPVAPTAMMDRIGDILGNDTALMEHLTRLCLVCRGNA